MQKVIGALIIVACVLGGYAMAHGDMRVLWQPAEVVIILGAGLGSLVVANPREVLLEMLSQVKGVFVYKRRGEEFQRQLLMMLYELLEMVDVGGLKVLDAHIEEPEQSDLFAKYPLIRQEKNLMAFIADNFRLMAMGKISAHELEGFLEQELEAMENGHGVHPTLIPGTFRPTANIGNDYLMDREAQRQKIYYSGIKGIAIQDSSLQESMGAIADRTRENLVSTDNAIIMARLRLRKAAKALEAGKGTPPGLSPETQQVRSASFILPEDGPFKETALDASVVRIGEPFVAV